MVNIIELPVQYAWYNTLNWQVAAGIVAKTHKSVDNWYLSQCLQVVCEKELRNEIDEFSPRLNIVNSHPWSIPFISKSEVPNVILKRSLHENICSSLEEGYYIYFNDVDDFYLNGKSNYSTTHKSHDGLITGLNDEENTYTIVAYDEKMILNKIKVNQNNFNMGFASDYTKGNGCFLFLKSQPEIIYNFDILKVKENITAYLLSLQTDRFKSTDKNYYGINAINYITNYLLILKEMDNIFDLIDIKIFRTLYENKTCIYNSLKLCESIIKSDNNISNNYQINVVDNANILRSLSLKLIVTKRLSILNDMILLLEKLIENETNILNQFINF